MLNRHGLRTAFHSTKPSTVRLHFRWDTRRKRVDRGSGTKTRECRSGTGEETASGRCAIRGIPLVHPTGPTALPASCCLPRQTAQKPKLGAKEDIEHGQIPTGTLPNQAHPLRFTPSERTQVRPGIQLLAASTRRSAMKIKRCTSGLNVGYVSLSNSLPNPPLRLSAHTSNGNPRVGRGEQRPRFGTEAPIFSDLRGIHSPLQLPGCFCSIFPVKFVPNARLTKWSWQWR